MSKALNQAPSQRWKALGIPVYRSTPPRSSPRAVEGSGVDEDAISELEADREHEHVQPDGETNEDNQADLVDEMTARVHLAIRTGFNQAKLDAMLPARSENQGHPQRAIHLNLMTDITRQLARVPIVRGSDDQHAVVPGHNACGIASTYSNLVQSCTRCLDELQWFEAALNATVAYWTVRFLRWVEQLRFLPPAVELDQITTTLTGHILAVIARWREQSRSAERRFCLKWSDLDRSSPAPSDSTRSPPGASPRIALENSSAFRRRLEGHIFSTVVYAFYIHGPLLRWTRRLGQRTGDYPMLGNGTYCDRVSAPYHKTRLTLQARMEMLSDTLEYVGRGAPDKVRLSTLMLPTVYDLAFHPWPSRKLGYKHAQTQTYQNALENFPDGWPQLRKRLKPYLERLHQQMPLNRIWSAQGTRSLPGLSSSAASSSSPSRFCYGRQM